MTRLLAAAALFAAMAGLAAPALAQPRLVPASDVQVLYHLSGPAAAAIPGGAADGVRLEWDAAGERLRSEPVGGPVYAIADLGRHVADVVFTAQNTYLELPLRAGDPQTLLDAAIGGGDAHFVRGNADRVGGIPCTDWKATARKLDATACITDDGVVLRASGTWDGHEGALTAVSVTRRALAADRFRPPAGFFRVNHKGGK